MSHKRKGPRNQRRRDLDIANFFFVLACARCGNIIHCGGACQRCAREVRECDAQSVGGVGRDGGVGAHVGAADSVGEVRDA